MRYFVAIVEQGSFSRAAAHLRIAQPALSLHVRNMENDLGTSLLFRSPKGVVPTEAGNILLKHARIILDQFTVAEEEIRGHENEPSGEVRLGLPGTISEILAVPLITAVHRRYPKIRLRIAEAMSGFVMEWIRASRIDLAVVYREISDEGLATIHLLDEELVFFGQGGTDLPEALPDPELGVTLADIAKLPLVLPGEAHGLRELLEQHARSAGGSLTVAIEVDAYSNIKELVASGFGYSILPLNAIKRETASDKLRYWRITSPQLVRPVHLAASVERPMTNATSAVLMIVQEVLRDIAENDGWIGATLRMNDFD